MKIKQLLTTLILSSICLLILLPITGLENSLPEVQAAGLAVNITPGACLTLASSCPLPAAIGRPSGAAQVGTTPELTLTKTTSHPFPESGLDIVYTIIVTNSGPVTATGGIISDALPSVFNPDFASFTISPPTAGDLARVPGDLPDLVSNLTVPPGQSVIVSVPGQLAGMGMVPTGLIITNTATVTSAEVITPARAVVTMSVINHDLEVVKTVSNPNPQPGEVVTFTIVVTNLIKATDDVTIGDMLPAQLTFKGPVVVTLPGGGTTAGTPPLQLYAHPNPLARGARLIVTFPVTVNTSLPAGTIITNIAGAASDEVTVPVTTSAVLVIAPPPPPDLHLSKTVNTLIPRPGQRITYTIVVSNTSLGSATGSLLSDALPDEVTFAGPVSLTPPGAGVTGSPPTLVSSLRITGGTRITVTVPVTVNTGLAAGTLVVNTASITSSEVATPVSDSATFTVTLPNLTLSKRVNDPTPRPGQRITYTILVTNIGPVFATGGVISDTLPDEVTFAGPVTLNPPGAGTPGSPSLLASNLTITPGTRITLTVPVTVSNGLLEGVQVTNTATVTSSEGPPPASGSVTFSPDLPSLALNKEVNDPNPELGQRITYTIVITNSGPAAATGARISDTLPSEVVFAGPVSLQPPGAGTTGTPPTLVSGLTITAGTRVTVTIPVTVGTTGVNIGDPVNNTATVTTTELTTSQSDSALFIVEPPTLTMTKEVSPAAASPGQTVIYTIIVTNTGLGLALDWTVEDTLPPNIIFQGPITLNPPGAGTTGTPPTLVSNLTIAAGSRVTISFPVQVDFAAPLNQAIINTAILRNSQVITTVEDSVSLSVTNANLAFSKAVNNLKPLPGEIVTYTLTISNIGQVINHNLILSDTLPTSFTLAGPITFEPLGLAYLFTPGNQGTLPHLAHIVDIFPNEVFQVTYPVKVGDDVPQGTPHTNNAQLSTDEISPPLNDSVTIVTAITSMTLTKEIDDPLPLAGQALTYTLRLTNTGDILLTGIAVTDTLPVSLTLAGAITLDPPGAGTPGGLPNVATIPSLSSGSSVTITLPVNLDPDVAQGTPLTNTATAASNELPDPISGSALLTVATPGLTLTKAVDNSVLPLPGQGITYTLSLTNTGDLPLSNLTISDTLPAGISFVGPVSFNPAGAGTAGTPPRIATIPTLAPGDSLTVFLPVRISATLTGGAIITNTAAVTSSEVVTPTRNSVALTVAKLGLTLTKRVNKTNPVVGEILTYTIIVTNTGNVEATDIVISDTLPPELTLIAPVSFNPPGAGTPGTLPRLAEIPTLAAGSRVTITFRVAVSAGATIGAVLINTASVTSAEVVTPTTAAVTVTVVPSPVPILVLTKGVNNPTPLTGSIVTYTLSITNIGQVNASGGRISDTLPAGLTFIGPVSLNPPGSGTPGSAGTLPTLASNVVLSAGRRLTLTFPVRVNSNVVSGTLITNRASVTSTQVATPATGQVNLRVIGSTTPTTPTTGPLLLPLILKTPPALPDLVGSFSLSPNQTNFAAGSPVLITVVVTNIGDATADSFWVDFYINPAVTPGVNVPWNQTCSLSPCYGIAWFVPPGLEPGESVTLTSTPASYASPQTIWPGSFAGGTRDLYLYVDSWNPTVDTGGVLESNELNNGAERHGLTVTGLGASGAGLPDPSQLPPRPAP